MTVQPMTTQTRILQVMGDECLLLSDLALGLMLPAHSVMHAASAMIQRGLVERVERGCYQLTEAGKQAAESGLVITSGPMGPLSGPRKTAGHSLKQRVWNVMRIRRNFTVPDLVAVASKPDDVAATTTVQEYIRALGKAAYVVATGDKVQGPKPNARHRVYRLTQNTGDIAPSLIRKETVLFDHNTNKEVAL